MRPSAYWFFLRARGRSHNENEWKEEQRALWRDDGKKD
jgi:hypothetical protein